MTPCLSPQHYPPSHMAYGKEYVHRCPSCANITVVKPTTITYTERRNMIEAHAEGWHTLPEGEPREFCPDCAR